LPSSNNIVFRRQHRRINVRRLPVEGGNNERDGHRRLHRAQ
jgi:hypothetical protein